MEDEISWRGKQRLKSTHYPAARLCYETLLVQMGMSLPLQQWIVRPNSDYQMSRLLPASDASLQFFDDIPHRPGVFSFRFEA